MAAMARMSHPRDGIGSRQVRRLAGLAAVSLTALLALAHGGVTGAALWVKITTHPGMPVAGESVTIHVETFFNQTPCLTDVGANPTPWAEFYPPLATLEITAGGPSQAPNHQAHVISLQRTPDDPTIWEGHTTFHFAGEWSLVMTRPSWPGVPVPDPCSGASILVTVLPATGATPAATPAATPLATPGS
jgi:hypothetical protein